MSRKKDHHFALPAVVFGRERIADRVTTLAARISRDYASRELTIISILKGSVVFCADLMRHLAVPCVLDFMAVASYEGQRSRGVVKIVSDLRESPVGKHLLVVEDIVDTGYTLQYLKDNLQTRAPASIRTCVLLDKPSARKVPIRADYVGFTAPDRFLVGYGLDYREHYRHLPYIGAVKGTH